MRAVLAGLLRVGCAWRVVRGPGADPRLGAVVVRGASWEGVRGVWLPVSARCSSAGRWVVDVIVGWVFTGWCAGGYGCRRRRGRAGISRLFVFPGVGG